MSSSPRIHIFFPFKEGPWGGANQFLKSLRDQWEQDGLLAPIVDDADVVLYNCSPGEAHLIPELAWLKRRLRLPIIFRIDGPVSLVRGRDKFLDKLFFVAVRFLADGVIFQSHWSRVHLMRMGLRVRGASTSILNAPDPSVFFPLTVNHNQPVNWPIRVIASSWSNNPRKGFAIYRWLDRNLDPKRFSFTFVGNAPVPFASARMVGPLASAKLADELRSHDIYLTASRCDPCSNSLIEAMHCGLPALVIHDGGHPQIVGRGGRTFRRVSELLPALEDMAEHRARYVADIDLPTREETARQYEHFVTSVVRRQALRSPDVHHCMQLTAAWWLFRLFRRIRHYFENRS